MDFTYRCYFRLVDLLRARGYALTDYHGWKQQKRCVILRHDIDNSIPKAVELAGLEYGEQVRSTYFVQLTSDFYNVFSKEGREGLAKLAGYGHHIGLHFDETCYPDCTGGGYYDTQVMVEMILREAALLQEAAGVPVDAVSMHRPGKIMLEADLEIPGMANSYGKEFFHGFKYLSDSRRHWREPVEEIAASGRFQRLHILTHPFWYNHTEKEIYASLSGFINDAPRQRYTYLGANFTDLESVMRMDENGTIYRS